eukprot:gene10812-13244_t
MVVNKKKKQIKEFRDYLKIIGIVTPGVVFISPFVYAYVEEKRRKKNWRKWYGKTTEIIQACNKVYQDVVYVSVPNVVDKFGINMGSAFNFDFNEDTNLKGYLNRVFTSPPPKDYSSFGYYKRLEPFIEEAATRYKQKHGKAPVLVIDNINWLALEDQKMLKVLQDFAKIHADKAGLIVVFVSSDGNGPKYLRDHSSFSRCRMPPYEIGDISDEEASEFLKRKGVDGVDLKMAELLVQEERPFPEIKEINMKAVITEFEKAGINPKDYVNLFKQLYQDEVMGGDIRFQSRSVETYVKF